MIKAVMLDIDNTLLDFGKCSEYAILSAAKELGVPFSPDYFCVFHTMNNRLWKKVEQQEITTDELYDIRWNLIFKELSVSADGHKFEKHFFRHLYESHEEVEEAFNLLSYLSNNYIHTVASNAPYEQQKKRLELSGMLPFLSHLFISEAIGHSKPSPLFFEACLDALSPILPEEIVMIGDSYSADIEGAHNAGMKTIWFNPLSLENQGAADYSVKRLIEINDIL